MVSQLQTLIDLASNVWQSNLKIMSFFAKLQTSIPSPETRHSWFQEPIRFEDALGRVIPIPSEYNWEVSTSLPFIKLFPYRHFVLQMVEAIIRAQFIHVGGYEEISADDYELFNTLDSSQIISLAGNEMIMPGLSI